MIDRRNFIKKSTTALGTTLFYGSVNAKQQEAVKDSFDFKVDGYNYHIPKFKKGSRILFQGDSITDMNWGRNQKDLNHYLGHGYVYLIAARLGVDLPRAELVISNRGNSGDKVHDLRIRWQADAIEMKPDILSILIGINDAEAGIKPESFESDYNFVLESSRKANPDLRIVLLEPFLLKCGWLKDSKVYKSRRAIVDSYRIVVDRLAKQYNAVIVKTQDIFDQAAKYVTPEHWIWDGIHPLPQGHELIARNWLQEVSLRWPGI